MFTGWLDLVFKLSHHVLKFELDFVQKILKDAATIRKKSIRRMTLGQKPSSAILSFHRLLGEWLIYRHATTRESLLKGKISTVDLLLLTRTYQMLLILNNFHFYFTKQAILMRRSTVLSLPLQKRVPCLFVHLKRFPNVIIPNHV